MRTAWQSGAIKNLIGRHSAAHRCRLFLLAALLAITGITAIAQSSASQDTTPAAKKAPAPNNPALIARGKYIVESVAMCSQCHTPRNSQNQPDAGHPLEGAPVWFKPVEPIADWPLKAPRLAGLVPGTDEEMVKLLTTGIWRTGAYLRPPMPQFRMTRPDAEAVVAYLRSVKSATN